MDLQERARLVAQHPATVQVLSLTSPNVYVFPPAEAVRAARLANRAYAQIKDRYPDRFRALASVPLGTGAELEELDYAVSDLGLDGVVVGTTVGSRPLDDPLLQPFWERANQLGLVVLLHPMGGLASPLLRDFSLVPLVGFPAETTVTLARLAYSGFFQRYPRVKVVAPHAGGALPYLPVGPAGQGVRCVRGVRRMRPASEPGPSSRVLRHRESLPTRAALPAGGGGPAAGGVRFGLPARHRRGGS
ncbi:MAG: hypothetical protein C4303_02210 [candidate division GAL15 bacterium]